MRAVVVHETFYGNTERVATAVAVGLRSACDVEIIPAELVTAAHLQSADLLIMGAATHGHGLPTAGSRRSAFGKDRAVPLHGLRELLAELPRSGRPAAAFDTRLRGPSWLTGAASRRIASALRHAGYQLIVPPESFVVVRSQGPLVVGEIERATAWGHEIAALVGSTQRVTVGAGR